MRVPCFKKFQITESRRKEIIEQVKKTNTHIAKPNKILDIRKLKKVKAKEVKENERKEILNFQEANVSEEKINEEYILYIREGSEQDVRSMIEIGADKDYGGGSSIPLFIEYERYSESESYYSRNESLNILNYLIDIVDLNSRDKFGKTILTHILEKIIYIEILLFDSREITEDRITNLVDIFKKVALKSTILDYQKNYLLNLAEYLLEDCYDNESLVLRNKIFNKITNAVNIDVENIDVSTKPRKTLLVLKDIFDPRVCFGVNDNEENYEVSKLGDNNFLQKDIK
jgi:hypothetical protein